MFKKHSSTFNNSKQRWSLRKMSIGLTSVLLGFVFLSGSQTVKADASSNSENQQNSTVVEGQQGNGVTDTIKQSDNLTKPVSQTSTDVQKSDENTTTLQINDVKSQNKYIALYENKLQDSGTDSQEDVTKNDQNKAKQLTTDDINRHIVEKYQNVLDEGDKANDWQKGLPTNEQQEKAETQDGTKILVDNPGWGPRPLVNNTIIYNGKTYKYIYQNKNGDTDGNVSSVYGMASTDNDKYWINTAEGFNFSNNLDKRINGDQGYTWRKTKDGNIVIEHKSSRDERIVNEGGAEWDIHKHDGHVTVSDGNKDSGDVETDDDFKEYDINLGIKEDLILTPEGNIVHKLTFTNNGNRKGEPMPFSYYTLIDTAMNGKDNSAIYSTKNNSLYISNNGMVYGIRTLSDGNLYAADNNYARTNDSGNLGTDISSTYGVENNSLDWPLMSDTDDTAIRVSTPVATLKKGDSIAVWYIETAFPESALNGKKIDEAIDEQLDLPVKDWINNLENKKNNDQQTQNNQDKIERPLKVVDNITSTADSTIENPITTDNPITANPDNTANTQKETDYSSLQVALNDLLPQLQDFIKNMGGGSVTTINLKPINLNNIKDVEKHMLQIHNLVHPVSETMSALDELHGSIRKSIVRLERSLPQLNSPALKANKSKRIKLRASLISKFNQELDAQIKKANTSFEDAVSDFKNAVKATTVDFLSNNGSKEIASAIENVVGDLVPEKATAQVIASWLINQINQAKQTKNGLNTLVDNLVDSVWNGSLTVGSNKIALSINGEKIRQNIFHNLFEVEPQELEKDISDMILGKNHR